MAQTIKIKRSSTSGNKLTSSNSVAGELGLNTADKALYIQTGSTNGDVVTIAHESTLKIDEVNGRIGIGTTTPDEALVVSGDGARIYVNSADYHVAMIGRRGSSGTSLDQGYIRLKDQGTNKVVLDTAGSSYFTGGNVGIGTTAPLSPLSVQADSGAGVARFIGRSSDNIASVGFYNSAQSADIYLQSNGSWFRSRAGSGFHFARSTTPTVTDTDGFTIQDMNLGIGTSSPGRALEVSTDGTAQFRLSRVDSTINGNNTLGTIEFWGTDDTSGTIGATIVGHAASTWGGGAYPTDLRFSTMETSTLSERMRITRLGDVSIGSDHTGFSGWKVLNIRQNSTGGMLNFEEDDGTRAFTFANQGVGMRYQAHITGGYHRFETHALGAGTAMMITDAGNVGIGTQSPAQHFEVNKASARMRLTDGTDQVNFGLWDGTNYRLEGDANRPLFITSYHTDGIRLGTSGSTHVTIKAGNVGIGTTSPAQKFHVKAGASGATTFDSRNNIILEDDGENYLGFYTPNNSFSGLRFVNADSSIRAHIDYYHGTQGDKFVMYSQEGWEFTYPSYGVQQVLKKNGNVGIRATNPPHDLTIYNAAGPTLYLVGGGYNDDVRIAFGGGDTTNTSSNGNTGAQIISTQSAVSGQARGNLKFLTNGGDLLEERIRITEDGNVGIGTTNPVYTLVVSEDGNDNIEIGGGVIQRYNRSSSAYQAMNYYAYSHNFYTTGGGHQSLFIKNDGNVGIGTSTPYSGTNVKSLTVNATSYPALALQIGGNNAGLLMSNSSGTDLYALGNKRLQFKTNDTTRIKIAGTGEVTFNEEYTFPTSDGSANQVLKTDGSGNLSFVTIAGAGAITEIEDADGDTKIQVEESADEDQIRFDAGGVERFRIGSDVQVIGTSDFNITGSSRRLSFTSGTGTVRTTGASSLHLGTNSTNRVTIDSSGNVGIGTSSPVRPLHIHQTSNSQMQFTDDTSGSTSADGLRVGWNGTEGQLYLFENAALRFATNATERMRIDSSGNVGIGTSTNLVNKLNVNGNQVLLANGELRFADSSNFQVATIKNSGGASTSQLNFLTSSTERMRIDSSGRVGIGTTSPNYKLDVAAAGGGINISGSGAYLRWNSGDIQIKNEGSYKMGFYTYNSSDAALNQHMVIDTNGYVGIGTASPAVELDIKRHTNAYPLRIGSSQGEGRAIVFADVAGTPTKYNWIAGTQYNINDGFEITPSTAVGGYTFSSPALVILPDGNVGIGATSPTSNLHVKTSVDNSVSQGIVVERSLNSDRGYINYTGGAFQFRSTVGDPIVFGETDAEHVRILPDGNVGIGTTAPAGRLDIQENSTGSILTRVWNTNTSGTGESVLRIANNGNNAQGSRLEFTDQQYYHSSISADRTNGIQFGTNATGSTGVATERMRINSSGDWMVSNTVANVASAYGNQGGCGWVDSDLHFEAATTSNRSAAEFGRNNANSGDVITIRQQGTSVGMIGTEGGDSLVIQSNGSTGTGIRFHPSRAAVEPVRAGVTIDATISLGADTRRFKDLHLSASANIGHASIQTDSTTTSATTQVAIDAFVASEFRSAEFTIQVTNSTDSTYHLTKVLLIHDGTTPGITEYGTVFTGSAAEATFDADISSGAVRLLATPASTDSMTFKVVRHCITV